MKDMQLFRLILKNKKSSNRYILQKRKPKSSNKFRKKKKRIFSPSKIVINQILLNVLTI